MHNASTTWLQAQAAVSQSSTTALAASKETLSEIKRVAAFSQTTADRSANIEAKLAGVQSAVEGVKTELVAVKDVIASSSEAAKQVSIQIYLSAATLKGGTNH